MGISNPGSAYVTLLTLRGFIQTVLALVYLLHINPVLATAYSLLIVGATSLAGSVSFMKNGLVDYKTALILPSHRLLLFTRLENF